MNDEYIIHCDCGAEAAWTELFEGNVNFVCDDCFVWNFDSEDWHRLDWTLHILSEWKE